MKTIKVLDNWKRVQLNVQATTSGPRKDRRQIAMDVTIFISPKGKMYRYAAQWEQPDLLITASVWAPEHDIRLCRVTDPQWKKTIQQNLRKNDHRRY